MSGPYSNPETGNALRCPECGSTDAECEDTPKVHRHVCNACGYEAVFRAARAALGETDG